MLFPFKHCPMNVLLVLAKFYIEQKLYAFKSCVMTVMEKNLHDGETSIRNTVR